ncbi:MAG: type IV pilin, partial [Thermoplasmata archaeon]
SDREDGYRLRRRIVNMDDRAGVSSIGTVLLVVLVVALISVVGVFLMGLATYDTEPPSIGIVMTSETDRMHAHINDVSESRPFDEFRLLARLDNGTMVMYDSDGDAVGDRALSLDLDELVVDSAAGPLVAPLVYVDADSNGKVSTGDYMTFRHPFFPPLAPFIDVTHGYKIVETAPRGIPRDTRMLIVASTDTLVGGEVRPGDVVRITIGKGSDIYYQTEGHASIGGVYTTVVDIPMNWSPATFGATEFTVRPGEADEWSMPYPFKVLPENPPSKAELAYWERLNNPVVDGTDIVLVHKPSNKIVLEFTV